MNERTAGRRLGFAAATAIVTLVGSAPMAMGQVPSRIPSDPEAQIFALIQRVTALEEKLSALTSGTATLRVKAPFQVVDAAGDPILQVVDGPAATRGGNPSGVVIANDPTSGVDALLIHNKAGEAVVLLGATDQGGGIGLKDDQGNTRLTMNGLGKFVISDQAGNSILAVAEDVSKEEANIRIGGDEGGYAVEVGDGNGAAVLGTDDQGIAELSLLDGQHRERASLAGDGTLRIAGKTGRDILSVAEDVTADSAHVTIGGEKDAYRVMVASANNAAVMGVTAAVAGFSNVQGGKSRSSLTLVNGEPLLNMSNEQGAAVVNLQVSGGTGLLQLGKGDGSSAVEAGVTSQGLGVVRAFPLGHPGAGMIGMPGTFLLGRW